MARTTRKFWTATNWREARKGGDRYRAERDAAWDNETPGQFISLAPWGKGNVRGGMLMSPSSSSTWRDEPKRGRAVSRRTIKRGQAQRVKAELWQEVEDYLAPDEDYSTIDFPLSGCCAECEADYAGFKDYEDYLYADEFFNDDLDWPYEHELIGLDYEGSATEDWRDDYRVNWDLWWD